MAVTEQNPLNKYTANGATTVFPYSFLALLAADLVVQITDTQGAVSTKALGVDYTVSGVGNASGGNVTMLAAPAAGSTVIVFRVTGLSRSTDYQQNGDLPSTTLNADLDRIWLAIQELANGLHGMPMAVRAPAGETLSALPSASARAGMALVFSSTGDVLVGVPASGSATDLAVNLATTNQAGKGAAMVGVRDAGGLIVATNVEDALQELASGKLAKGGDTMTGPLTLSGNVSGALQAVPKQQAESIAAAAVSGYERLQQVASKAATSGTSVTFSGADGVPTWAKRVTVVLDLVSTNGSDQVCVSLGTSGGIDKTGYQGSSCYINTTAGGALASTIGSGGATFPLTGASSTRTGRVVFENMGSNVWAFSGQAGDTAAGNVLLVSGRKALSGVLTQFAVTTINGTDTFDNGQVSVIYEG